MTRDELSAYLNDYLQVDLYQDYAPNGLQVEGKQNISRICTAVSASEAVILEACAEGADALLVHHGFFWRGEEPTVLGMKRRRLGHILAHDLNLFGFHLPIDCHLDIGNNACIAKLLDVRDVKTHRQGKNRDLLWSGRLTQSINPTDFFQFLQKTFSRQPIHMACTKNSIEHIAWCSGAAQDFIDDAAKLGVDAYISGEVSERTYYQAQELNTHYFACGHHATERYGIQALGEHLKLRFGLSHTFIDVNNPV
jgi:dinuclear metal center YbgI/SA1388 family protein